MNLKNKIILLLTLQLGNIYPVVMSVSLFTKDKKKVLIIGNLNVTGQVGQIVKDDQEDSKVIFEWIKNIDCKARFLLEEVDYSKPRILSEGYQGLCRELPKWAEDNYLKYDDLEFSLDDIRPRNFYKFLYINAIFNSRKEHTHNALFARKLAATYKVGDCSVEEFLQELQDIYEKIEQIIENFPDNGLVCTLFKSFEDKYDKFKDLFKTYYKTESLIDMVLEYKFYNQNIFNQLFSVYIELSNAIAILGFINALSEAVVKYDNVVVYVDNWHAQSINIFLRYCDYKEIFNKGQKETVVNYEKRIFESQELEQLLNTVFMEICANCKKEESCGRCGKCKAVYYCSRDCQIADWAKHKSNCEPAKPDVALAKSGENS